MKIIYNDVIQKKPEMEREVDATFYPSMEEMLPLCDCVLIATPYTGRPLLNAHTLALLPRGARVVNIARGVCIDEDDLADALESKHIGAAGLDVHAHEPRVSERLSKMDNVTLTSHTGGGSVETATGFERLVMENVEAVLEGREALTAVNQGLIDGYLLRDRRREGPMTTTANGVVVINGQQHDDDGANQVKVNGKSLTANGEATNGVVQQAGGGGGGGGGDDKKANNDGPAKTAVGNT